MNEKKFPHGEAPRQKDAALEDDTVEAVTGGKKASKELAEKAWDWVKQPWRTTPLRPSPAGRKQRHRKTG